MGTEPRATDAAATRLLVNVAGLVAREIEAIVGPDYDLPLAPKVGARICDIGVTQSSFPVCNSSYTAFFVTV